MKKGINIAIEYFQNHELLGYLPLDILTHDLKLLEYHRGGIIRDNENAFEAIGIIISGKADVLRGKAVINTLGPGDIFGIIDLFNSLDGVPTSIVAKNECVIAAIEKVRIAELIRSSPNFAEKYISYLSGKIEFLTRRIETINSGSAEKKLETLLLSSENNRIECDNMSLLAKKLDIGRATLYRTISSMENQGVIRRENETIILLK